MTERIELLSPAGTVEGMKAVISAGADAVYIGGSRFGARAYAGNAEEEELLRAIDYAHLRGVRVYLTVNTLFKEHELEELVPYLSPYYVQGLDAVLVQDVGALSVIRREFPDLPVHASTQMTVTGPESARLLKEMGVERVVAARELSLPELIEIREKAGIDVEVFIHGALCYCYSGQCILSSMIGGRSGNRGRCAQPCRLPYRFGDRTGSLLSTRDLCALPHLPSLIRAKVASLKIEGRMKRPEYAAGVTSVYRKYLDLLCNMEASGRMPDDRTFAPDPADLELLKKLYQREGFTDGYLFRRNGPDMMSMNDIGEQKKTSIGLDDLYDRIRKQYVEQEKPIPLTGVLLLEKNGPSKLSVSAKTGLGTVSATVKGSCAEAASTRPLTEQEIKSPIFQTGGTPYRFDSLEIRADRDLFIPKKALKDLRREVLAKLDGETGRLLEENRRVREAEENRSCKGVAGSEREKESAKPYLASSVETEEQFFAVLKVPEIGRVDVPFAMLMNDCGDRDPANAVSKAMRRYTLCCHEAGKRCFLAMPHIERRDGKITDECFGAALREADGAVARSFETFARLKSLGDNRDEHLPVIADDGLYAWNAESVNFWLERGAERVTVPCELNRRELRETCRRGCEIPVYGKQPLMVSAQCLFRNTEGCRHDCPEGYLADRTNARFYVRADCRSCYNVIYNSVPLDLSSVAGELLKLQPGSFRLHFTDEGGDECVLIAEYFADILLRGQDPSAVRTGRGFTGSRAPFTKGHYERGVQ